MTLYLLIRCIQSVKYEMEKRNERNYVYCDWAGGYCEDVCFLKYKTGRRFKSYPS